MSYTYEVNSNTGYATGGSFISLEWTTRHPAQEGWYWVFRKGGIPTLKEYRGVILDVYFPDTYWIGPIPTPEKPE